MIVKKMLLYLKIIQDMERTHPDFYEAFRNHKDWEIGLTHTISIAEEMLGEEE
tara:strand:+ start:798 stop:956 length:159 start_codon:yes stop_codon:yes gene_type:complete